MYELGRGERKPPLTLWPEIAYCHPLYKKVSQDSIWKLSMGYYSTTGLDGKGQPDLAPEKYTLSKHVPPKEQSKEKAKADPSVTHRLCCYYLPAVPTGLLRTQRKTQLCSIRL